MPPAAQEADAGREPFHEWVAGNVHWLQAQVTPNPKVPNPDPSRRRLLISYDLSPEKSPSGFHRSATYDDAVAALALMCAGEMDQAAFTLHALARLVRPDGSLWFGYNTANDWPGERDHEGALVRAGSVAWAGYAMAFYLAHEPGCAGDGGCARERAFLLEAATRLADYLLSLQVNNPADPRDGLIRLGHGLVTLAYQPATNRVTEIYYDVPANGVSTENNISSWFFLHQLAALTGETRWSLAAGRIQAALLKSLWNDNLGQFNEGFDPEGASDAAKALDAASWGALFLLATGQPEKARQALANADRYFAVRDGAFEGYQPYSDIPIFGNPEVGKFFFPDNPRKQWRELPLVWTEGTLGVALAVLRVGEADRARSIVEALRPLQGESTGLRYASRAIPFNMSDAPGVAASAWLVIVAEALIGNPLTEQFWR